jgi:hypothetical protein
MIAAILSLLGSSAVGSLLGGVFAWLNKKNDLEIARMNFEQEKAKWANDLLMRDKDLEYARQEAAGRKEVAIVEGDAAVDTARMTAIGEAHKADAIQAADISAAGSYGWAVALAFVINKFVRPVLTLVLCFAALKTNLMVMDFFTSGWAVMTPDQRFDAGMQAFAWVTGQASAVIGYWFVSRGKSK